MRHHRLVFVMAVLLGAAWPAAARSESRIGLETGAAFMESDRTPQLGVRFSFGAPNRIGGSVSFGLLPSYFDEDALGALLDGGVVRPIALGRTLALEPQAGVSLLGVWAGLGGIAVGGHAGAGLTLRLEERLSANVRFTYRRLHDWDDSVDLSSLTVGISWTMGGSNALRDRSAP